MEVVKPIFMIGTGRSGSSAINALLARHPRIAYLSALSSRYPARPQLNRLALSLRDRPLIGRLVEKKLGPTETYAFWNHHYRGFGQPTRDLVAGDVTNDARAGIRSSLQRTLTARRDRLFCKITGWPRVGFLHEIFPDAIFVHLVRDGRDVAASLMKRDFWQGWRGPQNWRFGELPTDYGREWERYDRSFVVLAGIHWKIILDAVERARQAVPAAQYLEVRYEDFVNEPVETLKTVIEVCDLEWTSRFEKQIAAAEVVDRSSRWRSVFTNDQQRILEESLRGHLARLGYV